jgi:hypothetical protein
MKNSHGIVSGSIPSHEVFSKLLRHLSAAELKKFLEETVSGNEALLHRVIIHFVGRSDLAAEEKFAAIVDSILQLSVLEKKDATVLEVQMNRLLEQAEQMIDAKNFLDGFFVAASIIRQGDHLPAEQKQLWTHFITKSFELLEFIVKSESGFDLKEKIFSFLITEARPSAIKSSLIKDRWLNALLECATEESQLLQVLEIIGELIGKNRSQSGAAMDEEEAEQLVKAKLKVLEKLNRGKDIHRLLEANKHIKAFRLRLVDDSLQQNDLDRAKELIKEGKRLDERKGNIYLGTDWDELLLKIAQQEHDTKAIRNSALQLFIAGEFDFDYYYLLKEHYDPSRWKSQVDRIVNHIRKESSFPTKGIHAVAKIFIEEEEWEKLLLLLQKNANLEFIEVYFDILKEKFPQELLEIYRRAVRRYAEKYMGNEVYRMVANTLKKMQSLRGGREIVQSLAIELKVDYRQRKSFVDELNKVVL